MSLFTAELMHYKDEGYITWKGEKKRIQYAKPLKHSSQNWIIAWETSGKLNSVFLFFLQVSYGSVSDENSSKGISLKKFKKFKAELKINSS